MKKWLVVVVVGMIFQSASAQDLVVAKLRSETSRNIKKENDTTTWNWKTGGLYNFNLSQNVTSSAATYSISATCNNSGGCSLTVNQNN